jgi:hypothetical protein
LTCTEASSAATAGGAWLWASGSHTWSGKMAILVPRPITISAVAAAVVGDPVSASSGGPTDSIPKVPVVKYTNPTPSR